MTNKDMEEILGSNDTGLAVKDDNANALSTMTEEEALQALNAMGNMTNSYSGLILPMLKLEHTTDQEGEANPLKGKFTIGGKDSFGNWTKEDLGKEIQINILLQRYAYKLVKNGTTYSSKEFDTMEDIIDLWEMTGTGETKKSNKYATGTHKELSRNFIVEKDGKNRCELIPLSVLYVKIGDRLVKWKTNMTGTFAYRDYQKKVSPAAMITKVSAVEKKNGSVKYYVPVFEALGKVESFAKVFEEQKALRELLTSDQAELIEE